MPEGVADERGFNLLRRMREEAGKGLSLAEFKQLLREQFFMLMLDERRAVEAIPAMLAKDQKLAASLADTLRQLLGVVGIRTAAAKARLREIEAMFKSIGTLAPGDMAKAQSEAVFADRHNTVRSAKRI
jgi:DNA-binding transcriptional MerR regulator